MHNALIHLMVSRFEEQQCMCKKNIITKTESIRAGGKTIQTSVLCFHNTYFESRTCLKRVFLAERFLRHTAVVTYSNKHPFSYGRLCCSTYKRRTLQIRPCVSCLKRQSVCVSVYTLCTFLVIRVSWQWLPITRPFHIKAFFMNKYSSNS